jgi:LacI family transcriptional regulator
LTKRPDAQTDLSLAPPGRRSAVTVHDVARLAGVSSMTVSRVVNGTKVREEMRAKVEAAIQELNYVPNLAARAARSGRSASACCSAIRSRPTSAVS